MTPTKEQIEHALSFFDQEPMNVVGNRLAAAYRAKCAEVEELREALKELMSIVKIHSRNTDNNFAWAEMEEAEKALEGKE